MSFPLQRSETEKDEEELPAREGDPLLPAAGRVRPNSNSSFIENPANRGSSLRARRTSRSPTLEPKAGFPAAQSLKTTHSTTLASISAQRQSRLDSQMTNADDETSTVSSAIFNAAAAAETSAADDKIDQATIYVDFADLASQANSTHPPLSLASSAQQSDDTTHNRHHLLPSTSPRSNLSSTQHNSHHGIPSSPGPALSQYEPPPYRPPSPDEGRTDARSVGSGSQDQPPLLEIPEEIYAVRKAALKVLKPLTKTWVSVRDSPGSTVELAYFQHSEKLIFRRLLYPLDFRSLSCSEPHDGLY